MPVQIPSAPELVEMVNEFRAELRDEEIDQIVDRILDPDRCFCVDQATRQGIGSSMAAEFAFAGLRVVFVGSAQLGFSIVEKANMPRYRGFTSNSDIDVAIIDSDIFDRVWSDTFLHFVENRPWPFVQDFQKYFFRGWIRPDKLPYNTAFRSRWFDYFRNLSRAQFDSEHAITCALYKSEVFLREYQKRAIRECRGAEETQ